MRHGAVHVPTKDIIAAPGSCEIRENQKKHVWFYAPVEALCYETAENTVGGIIYDVHPLIRIEFAPLTDSKFSIRLASVFSSDQAESVISRDGSTVNDSFTTFLLRWDRDNVQVRTSRCVSSFFPIL